MILLYEKVVCYQTLLVDLLVAVDWREFLSLLSLPCSHSFPRETQTKIEMVILRCLIIYHVPAITNVFGPCLAPWFVP